ncbi:hypothetical protein I3U60_24865 [Mycobacteroides abscessus subsp. massiliense]|nr:hypothetical protein [Mycobacteroides abscessus subsp. massiliense]
MIGPVNGSNRAVVVVVVPQELEPAACSRGCEFDGDWVSHIRRCGLGHVKLRDHGIEKRLTILNDLKMMLWRTGLFFTHGL